MTSWSLCLELNAFAIIFKWFASVWISVQAWTEYLITEGGLFPFLSFLFCVIACLTACQLQCPSINKDWTGGKSNFLFLVAWFVFNIVSLKMDSNTCAFIVSLFYCVFIVHQYSVLCSVHNLTSIQHVAFYCMKHKRVMCDYS